MGLRAVSAQDSGAPPTGAAGGDLTGTYPNPTIKASVALTTPNIGAATATSVNNVVVTAVATAATLTLTTNTVQTFPTTTATLARTDAGQTFTGNQVITGSATVGSATAITAGGSLLGYNVSSTANFGVFVGSGAPSISAAKGSLYLRSDGGGANDRAYIATTATGTWTPIVTVG